MSTIYKIQQSIRGNWETLPEGEFDTEAAALSAMDELEDGLGWRNLRVVADYCNDEDRFGWSPLRVIAYYGNDTSTEAAMCGLEGSK